MKLATIINYTKEIDKYSKIDVNRRLQPQLI